MSVKILSSTLVGLDGFCHDPLTTLQQADNGTLAVLHNNVPAFYAITPQRLAHLLALEAAAQQPNDVTLDDSLFHSDAAPITVPVGTRHDSCSSLKPSFSRYGR